MYNMNTLTIIALILIFFGGIGAILLTIGQTLSSQKDKSDIIATTKDENIQLKSDLDEIKMERDNLRKGLEIRDQKIYEQSEKIESLSNRIAEKSEYIANFVSGGQAYPILELKMIEAGISGNAYLVFSIENPSDFPIYNIETQVFNYTQLKEILIHEQGRQIPKVNKEKYLSTIIFENLTTELPPKQFRMTDKPYTFENVELIAIVRTRVTAFVQKIVLQKHGNRIYGGYSVHDYKGNLLKQHVYESAGEEVNKKIREKLNNLPNNINVTFTN